MTLTRAHTCLLLQTYSLQPRRRLMYREAHVLLRILLAIEAHPQVDTPVHPLYRRIRRREEARIVAFIRWLSAVARESPARRIGQYAQTMSCRRRAALVDAPRVQPRSQIYTNA